MRENRTHGSEGGDGESRFRPLSEQRLIIDAQIIAARVFSKECSMSLRSPTEHENRKHFPEYSSLLDSSFPAGENPGLSALNVPGYPLSTV